MKKVLCICYFFPPLGMSQRSLKFCKYLHLFGWEPIVLAPESSTYHRQDPTLLTEVPRSCRVIRVPESEEVPNAMIRTEDFQKGWYPEAVKVALKLLQKEKVDMIYTTASPYLSHMIGLKIKELTGIPWVADFRDEWTTNPYIVNKYPPKQMKLNQQFEQQVLTRADKVITVSDEISNILYRQSSLKSNEKFFTIMNGFDPADFPLHPKNVKNDRFTMCYMGSLYGLRRRLANQFFQIIDHSLQQGKLNKDELKVLFVGDPLPQPGEWMKGITENSGYLDHQSALKKALSSDLLLLFISPQEGNQTVTSKIFELINTKKPILAIVPEAGVAAEIIRKTRTGVVVDSRFPEKAIPHILRYYHQWKTNQVVNHSYNHEIQRFSRIEQTKMLAQIMHSIVTK